MENTQVRIYSSATDLKPLSVTFHPSGAEANPEATIEVLDLYAYGAGTGWGVRKLNLKQSFAAPQNLIYAAEELGVPIGYVIDHPYDEHSREIGWVLLPEYWGRGYAAALTDLLIQRAGQERRQLVIECAPQQQATKCIAVRKGFRYQGLIDGLDVYRLE